MARRSVPGTDSVCCVRCFRDRALVKKIQCEGRRGSCPWCGATNVPVLPVEELGELFRELAAGYLVAASENGEWIDQLFQEDWEIFADDIYMSKERHALALAILESGLDPKDDVLDYPDYHDLYVRREASDVDLLGQWGDRVAEIFGYVDPIKKANADIDFIAEAIAEVGRAYSVKRQLFRARIHDDRGRRSRLTTGEMGAPPPNATPIGRANRAGEPVLYLASTEHTALAEARAWKGAIVAVARMQLPAPVKILDLVKAAPSIGSPFDVGHLTWFLEARSLLREFGRELSRPVTPKEKDQHYLPSQQACDAVRAAGFAGIAYPSAMGAGHNVVLFDPSAAIATEVAYHRVIRTQVRATVILGNEIRIDDYPYD